MKALYEIFLASAGVSTDSRTAEPGTLFFALKGGNFDGNRFAADALDKGAAFAVVDDPRVAIDERYLVVDNVLLTLQHLAAYHRRQIGVKVLAITGTNGKTTTKELVSRVLAARFRTASTVGNLNNHIGVPLTLLAMREGDFAVVEMGASAPGEIGTLCRIAEPDYGIITNIGRAHLEGFGGPEGVRRTKGELYDYLAVHGGVAFVNADDPVLCGMAAERGGLVAEYYPVGAAEGYRNNLTGAYNMANIAAAVAVGTYFGVPDDEIHEAIESYVPDNNRSQRVETERNTLVMDCYNANPSSMRASLADFAAQVSKRPKTVILGDMRELGAYSAEEHELILKQLEELGLGDVYLVGENFTRAVRNYPTMPAPIDIKTFADTETLASYIQSHPIAGHLILVKGSRGLGLERVEPLL